MDEPFLFREGNTAVRSRPNSRQPIWAPTQFRDPRRPELLLSFQGNTQLRQWAHRRSAGRMRVPEFLQATGWARGPSGAGSEEPTPSQAWLWPRAWRRE